jgi:hypothetical protein
MARRFLVVVVVDLTDESLEVEETQTYLKKLPKTP